MCIKHTTQLSHFIYVGRLKLISVIKEKDDKYNS